MVQGPIVLSPEEKINFVYHIDSDSPLTIFFNSKGQDIAVYTKLGSSEELEKHNLLLFPTAATTDPKAVKTGHVTTILYD